MASFSDKVTEGVSWMIMGRIGRLKNWKIGGLGAVVF
jgi:hypothetical protein